MTATYLSGPDAVAATAKSANKSDKPSLFRRIVDVVATAQQRRAEQEIAKFLATRGGRFSDSAEREIEHHFLNPRIF